MGIIIGFFLLFLGAFCIGVGVERALSALPAIFPSWFYLGFGIGAFFAGFALFGKSGVFANLL